MKTKLPRLLEEGRVEVRLSSFGGTHVFEESGIDRLQSHLTEAKRLLNPEEAERGLVCMFCGEGFGYAGSTPDEATLRTAVDHEKKCTKNPYRAEVERLTAEVSALQSLTPHPGDGSCERCGVAPAVPVSLCVECRGTEIWRSDPPDEQALWWWWNGDLDAPPIVVDIFVSNTITDLEQKGPRYFATQGQHGWNRSQWVEDMKGLWMRCIEPSLPESV